MLPGDRLLSWGAGLLLIAVLSLHVKAGSDPHKVYLNSGRNCGQNHEVTVGQSYTVQENMFSDSVRSKSFRECQVRFHANDKYGSLCLVQQGEESYIKDDNAELVVYDGLENDGKKIETLTYYPDVWTYREYCTNEPYLEFYIRKILKLTEVDNDKIYINFKVLDIKSKERTLYLEEYFCEHTYRLNKSQVTIYNRHSPWSAGKERTLESLCGLQLKKPENSDSSICFAYIPHQKSNCSRNNWEFAVLTGDFDLDEDLKVYKLPCGAPDAHKAHAWCADNQTHSVTLLFQRGPGLKDSGNEEPVEMFRYIVADYEGTSSQFLKKIDAEMVAAVQESESLDKGYIALIVILSLLLIAGLLAVLYTCRAKLCCKKYRSVPSCSALHM